MLPRRLCQSVILKCGCCSTMSVCPLAPSFLTYHQNKVPTINQKAASLPVAAGGIDKLPALESLHAEMRETAGPLASPTLQQLSLEGLCGFTLHSYPSLGSLPRLRRLHIKLLPNLAVSPSPPVSPRRLRLNVGPTGWLYADKLGSLDGGFYHKGVGAALFCVCLGRRRGAVMTLLPANPTKVWKHSESLSAHCKQQH